MGEPTQDPFTFVLNPRHDQQAAIGYDKVFEAPMRRVMFGIVEDLRYDAEEAIYKAERIFA